MVKKKVTFPTTPHIPVLSSGCLAGAVAVVFDLIGGCRPRTAQFVPALSRARKRFPHSSHRNAAGLMLVDNSHAPKASHKSSCRDDRERRRSAVEDSLDLDHECRVVAT